MPLDLRDIQGGELELSAYGTDWVYVQDRETPLMVVAKVGSVYFGLGRMPGSDPLVNPYIITGETRVFGGERQLPDKVGFRAVGSSATLRVMQGPFVSGASAGSAGADASIPARVVTLESVTAAQQGEINALEGRVAVNEGDIASQDSRITVVENRFLDTPTTYYFSPAGSDSTGDGSSGNPWRSFRKGFDEVLVGSTIVGCDITFEFADGSYDVNPMPAISAWIFPFGYLGVGTTYVAPFGIKSQDGGKLKLVSENPQGASVGTLLAAACDYVVFDGWDANTVSVGSCDTIEIFDVCVCRNRSEGWPGIPTPRFWIQETGAVGIDGCYANGGSAGIAVGSNSVAMISGSVLHSNTNGIYCVDGGIASVDTTDTLSGNQIDIQSISHLGGGIHRVTLTGGTFSATEVNRTFYVKITDVTTPAEEYNGTWPVDAMTTTTVDIDTGFTNPTSSGTEGKVVVSNDQTGANVSYLGLLATVGGNWNIYGATDQFTSNGGVIHPY